MSVRVYSSMYIGFSVLTSVDRGKLASVYLNSTTNSTETGNPPVAPGIISNVVLTLQTFPIV